MIVDAPRGSTSSSTEENFGFWIDEATKIVTLADGKKLIIRRFDDHWVSAAIGDVSYELDRQNGNLSYASSTMKDGIATTMIGAGRCTLGQFQRGRMGLLWEATIAARASVERQGAAGDEASVKGPARARLQLRRHRLVRKSCLV